MNVAAPGTGLTAGDVPAYLAAWEPALSIGDGGVELQKFEQTIPGFLTLYGQLRVASSVVDPFAIVRLTVTA